MEQLYIKEAYLDLISMAEQPRNCDGPALHEAMEISRLKTFK